MGHALMRSDQDKAGTGSVPERCPIVFRVPAARLRFPGEHAPEPPATCTANQLLLAALGCVRARLQLLHIAHSYEY